MQILIDRIQGRNIFMTKYHIFLLILLINALLSLAYLIYMGSKKQIERGILIGAVMLIMPVGGPLMIFFSYLCFLLLKHTKAAYIDPAELSFRKEKIRIIEGDSLQRGINKVPIEEALLESDSESTRRVLLDVLKVDFESSIPILMKAIENEDSEVSHYASAAISDVLSKFKKHQKEIDEQYREHMEDEELLTAYRKYVYKYLAYHIFPKTEETHYLELCSELMEQAYKLFSSIEPEDYENWIKLLVEYDKQGQAKEWLRRMQKAYPDNLSTYKAELQYCYRFEHQNFGKCLQKMKDSQIMLDEDTLELVRFFQIV